MKVELTKGNRLKRPKENNKKKIEEVFLWKSSD